MAHITWDPKAPHSNYHYVETALGRVTNRGNVSDLSSFSTPQNKTDCFASYFRFDEAFNQFVEENKSVTGFTGLCVADFLPFDIDGDKNSDTAYLSMLTFITRLREQYDCHNFAVLYSGCKGFHILIPAAAFGGFEPSNELPSVLKRLAKEIAGNVTIDTTIYQHSRLLRLPNTIHSETGLYKRLVPEDELDRGLPHILKLAQSPGDIPDFGVVAPAPKLVSLLDTCHNSALDVRPDSDTVGILYAYEHGVDDGFRNEYAAKIAGHFAGTGVGRDLLIYKLSNWNEKNRPKLPEKRIIWTVDSIVRKEASNTSYRLPVLIDQIGIFSRVQHGLVDQVKAEYEWGQCKLDDMVPIGRGKFYIVSGSKGTAKTKFLVYTINQNLSRGVECIFFSLDMDATEVIRRFVSVRGEIDSSIILRAETAKEIAPDIERQTGELGTLPLTIVDGQRSMNEIVALARLWRKNISVDSRALIALDFLQLIPQSGSSSQHETYVRRDQAFELSRLAKELQVPVLVILQHNRQSETQKPHMSHIDGTGGPAQAADAVFVIDLPNSRKKTPERTEDDFEEFNIIVGKNREGRSYDTLSFEIHLPTGAIRDPNRVTRDDGY
ncbi:MAG: primase C-terminal domain-containing protein [Candidatus Krumholzibacteriota bacterium]|nr:primase C-terminal domain-containing protein [Candidatus Krumholzibacteriota bacterium]